MSILTRLKFAAAAMIACAGLLAVPQLGGCTAGVNSMGSTLLPNADTFNKRLAAGYVLNTAVRRASVALMNSGTISAVDGENTMAANDAARAGLDIAATLSKVDLAAADGKLTAVSTTLMALEAYLTARSK